MVKSIKADIYRILKSASGFYATAILLLLGIFFSFVGKDNSSKEIIENGLSNGTLLLPVFLTNTFVISWGHEFSYRLVNNSLISGIKRYQFFFSKVLLTFFLTVIFISVFSVSLFISTYFISGSVPVMSSLKILMLQLPLYLAASSLGILLFNVLNSSYLSIATFISIAFIGDTLIGTVISTYFSNFDVLLDTMFFSNLRNLIGYQNLSDHTIQVMVVSSLAYSVVALLISFQVFRKREFK